jgi:hypothetical protein
MFVKLHDFKENFDWEVAFARKILKKILIEKWPLLGKLHDFKENFNWEVAFDKLLF